MYLCAELEIECEVGYCPLPYVCYPLGKCSDSASECGYGTISLEVFCLISAGTGQPTVYCDASLTKACW